MTTNTQLTLVALTTCLVVVASFVAPALAGAVAQATVDPLAVNQQLLAHLESPTLRLISDEDQALLQHVKHQIDDEYANFKNINEVHTFLDKVKLLVQKHPKNTAFAQGDLKDLYKFLSQEIVTRLIRVDAEPFSMPITDEKMPFAQRAIDEDELTRKLFSGPLRSLIEAKRAHSMRTEDGNHRDGNFFSNFWCKISGSCPN